MEKTLQIINQLKEEGIIKSYSIAGAVASIFYVEPVTTYDLDVFIVLADNGNLLVSLAPIYDWFRNKGYEFDKEHVLIMGVPVQFIPVYNKLVNEALENSIDKKYGETVVKVISPEYLIAIMLDTFRTKDKERILRFLEEAEINNEKLDSPLKKYDLVEKYLSIIKPI